MCTSAPMYTTCLSACSAMSCWSSNCFMSCLGIGSCRGTSAQASDVPCAAQPTTMLWTGGRAHGQSHGRPHHAGSRMTQSHGPTHDEGSLLAVRKDSRRADAQSSQIKTPCAPYYKAHFKTEGEAHRGSPPISHTGLQHGCSKITSTAVRGQQLQHPLELGIHHPCRPQMWSS